MAAIGSPFGQASSLAVGVVSAIGRSVSSLTSVYNVVDAIQTDAPINRGNSGGPLFNARGEVIGINAQIRSESGNAEGVGFAIPINTARRSMEQLIETGVVRYAWVGSLHTDAHPLARRGARLFARRWRGDPDRGSGQPCCEGRPSSPERPSHAWTGSSSFAAATSWSRSTGARFEPTEDLVRIVAGQLFPGERAEFTVVRDGERIVLPVVLEDRPADPDVGR